MSKKESAVARSRPSVNRNRACSVDSKGRVLLPAIIREALGENVQFVKDIQRYLRVYTSEVFAEEEETFAKTFSRGNRAAMKYRMAFLSNGEDGKIDSAGRLLIPQDCREWAQLGKECVVIANGIEFLIMSVEDYKVWEKAPSKFRVEENIELEALRKAAYDEEKTLRELRSGVGA